MKDYKIIDINADVGEGIGNEANLMPFLSSCNIACGGHAGDYSTMTEVVRMAKQHKVKIGVHPSLPDKENFGRVDIDISPEDLYNSLRKQIEDFQFVLKEENAQLHHLKPHGALYNLAAKDEKIAKVILDVLKSIAMQIKLYAPFKSVIAELALKENIEVTFEAFADRNYNENLSLVSRKNNTALLTSKVEILDHLLRMVEYEKVRVINGVEVPIKASTFCVHGDTKNALEILEYLNQELPKHQIKIA